MRRSSRRTICQPAAVSGEQVAARAQRNPYGSRDPYSTGSLANKKSISRWFGGGRSKVNEEDEFEDH